MSAFPKLTFASPGGSHRRVVVVFTDNKLRLGKQASALKAGKLIERAAKAGDFKGKPRAMLNLLAPSIDGVDRLLVVGIGAPGEATEFLARIFRAVARFPPAWRAAEATIR